jgi:hypothetical protein
MRIIHVPALSLALAVSLCGQAKKFSWQDACFNNPGAPYCQGHDFAIKKSVPTNAAPPPAAIRGTGGQRPSPTTRSNAAPALLVVGSIDWRFADPFPDVLIGINFNSLAASPLARNLISQLGAQQGIAAADIQKIFDGLSDVDQVAISMRANRMVVMVTGRVTNNELPAPEAGLKIVPVSGNAMLIGHSDAVDEAVRRMAGPSNSQSDMARDAAARQAASEFWAIGEPRLAGPQAAGSGLRKFYLTVSIRSRFVSDIALEFNAVPPPNAIKAMQTSMGAVTVEANFVHLRMSMEAEEVQQKFASIATSPFGKQLGNLVAAAKYLPARDTSVPKQTKPVIYGLDDGPKVVNQ